MSLGTENLQKHIDALEEKRIAVFFNMHNTAQSLAGRLYIYHLFVGAAGIAVFAVNRCVSATHSPYFIHWSTLLALTATIIALFHYLLTFDSTSAKLYRDICAMYKGYDDEYYILKRYTTGHIEESLIRQFYVGKNTTTDRYTCHPVTPSVLSWIATSLLTAALILTLLA